MDYTLFPQKKLCPETVLDHVPLQGTGQLPRALGEHSNVIRQRTSCRVPGVPMRWVSGRIVGIGGKAPV